MQQPRSIKRFDLFYLSSIAVGTVGFFIGYDDTLRRLHEQTAGTGMEMGAGFTTTTFIIGLAITLLLWWLVSAKRSAVAKWILIVLSALSLLGLPGLFENLTLATILQLLSLALSLVAIYFLFQPDTKPWFDKDERP
jgi:hypothetical protein